VSSVENWNVCDHISGAHLRVYCLVLSCIQFVSCPVFNLYHVLVFNLYHTGVHSVSFTGIEPVSCTVVQSVSYTSVQFVSYTGAQPVSCSTVEPVSCTRVSKFLGKKIEAQARKPRLISHYVINSTT